MISEKEHIESEFQELTNELKKLRFQVGDAQWKSFFVENPEFKEEIDDLITLYKQNPEPKKAEVLYYLGIFDLAEPKVTHSDLFDPNEINI